MKFTWQRPEPDRKLFGPFSILRVKDSQGGHRYLVFKGHTRTEGKTQCLGGFPSGEKAEQYVEQQAEEMADVR